MHMKNNHFLNGFAFNVSTSLTAESRFRGIILITQRGDTNEVLTSAFAIETPSAFKSVRAAEIEASAYAHELIATGAILTMLDLSASGSIEAASTEPKSRK